MVQSYGLWQVIGKWLPLLIGWPQYMAASFPKGSALRGSCSMQCLLYLTLGSDILSLLLYSVGSKDRPGTMWEGTDKGENTGGRVIGGHPGGWLPHLTSQPDQFKELYTLSVSTLCSHLFTQTVLPGVLSDLCILKSNGFFSALTLERCTTSSPPPFTLSWLLRYRKPLIPFTFWPLLGVFTRFSSPICPSVRFTAP